MSASNGRVKRLETLAAANGGDPQTIGEMTDAALWRIIRRGRPDLDLPAHVDQVTDQTLTGLEAPIGPEGGGPGE
jgi:hypothetical protein